VSAADLAPLLPVLALVAGAFALLLADLLLPAEGKRVLGFAAAATVCVVLAVTFVADCSGEAFGGAFEGSAFTLFVQRTVLVAALVGILGGIDFAHATWQHRQGEYHVLILLSVAGMMLLPGARDLVLFAVAFETMGIPLYILASCGKNDAAPRGKNEPVVDGRPSSAAAEAGLKLYLVGAASSAVTLFGLALVAGLAGGTSFERLSLASDSPLLALGVVLALAGMGFKVGVAPFHAWIADTYQGAATPFVAFLSVAPKVAGFVAMTTLFLVALPQQALSWLPVLVVLSALTMLAGNLLAIPQTNVKRLLGFSGVAQVGYVLMALAAGGTTGLAMVLFYLATYVVANAGAFLVAHAVAEADRDESVSGMDGLARRAPWLGLAMLLFLLSLAGIPFLAGFWAKLYAFVAAWQAGLGSLVVAGAVLATVALFYYLRVARAMYVEPARREGSVRVGAPLALAILLCLAAVVALGLHPRPLLDAAQAAAESLVSSR